ncbi:E3 ubiquitin-protein ligase SP1-like [Prunus yedoensis var. nudiflora]|uniref:E3 ubiquitin-protein ligase SP1-like n=1 Tax=Prunus yedoensis var. nudiflora TaxID=2094558 RepID=A0A314Z9U9_PRUYE|nr:E3 ubiquitin-protein ligase SP1-like [Prunus yedoensis var. nudiflora]
MIESIGFFLLGGVVTLLAAPMTGQFMSIFSKDSSFLFSRAQQADNLASVPQIREFKDLEPLLKSQNRLMVALRGNVGSETPMNCEFSELQGVVVEKTDDGTFHVNVVELEVPKAFTAHINMQFLNHQGAGMELRH